MGDINWLKMLVDFVCKSSIFLIWLSLFLCISGPEFWCRVIFGFNWSGSICERGQRWNGGGNGQWTNERCQGRRIIWMPKDRSWECWNSFSFRTGWTDDTTKSKFRGRHGDANVKTSYQHPGCQSPWCACSC